MASGPDLTYNGGQDAFVAKVNPAGAALLCAGYLGGSSWEVGEGIAVDDAGNAYVTGNTSSDQTTFPVVGGPDLTANGAADAFVIKIGEGSQPIRALRAGARPVVDSNLTEWQALSQTLLNKDTASSDRRPDPHLRRPLCQPAHRLGARPALLRREYHRRRPGR